MNPVLVGIPLLLAALSLSGCDDGTIGVALPYPGGADYEDGDKVGGEDDDDDPTNNGNVGGGVFNGGADNTFSHMDDLGQNGGKDPFEILQQREEEGSPSVRARLHSCQKPQLRAIRNILNGFGVDLGATGNPDPAGELLAKGSEALGGANYDARQGEALVWSNSGATKFQDIFVQAAPEIIANLSNVEQCQLDGVGVEMFDANDKCNPDAITCLIGKPATPEHIAICNQAVQSATDITIGKNIAVGALLSAAHSCE